MHRRDIPIASPCTADWTTMKPSDKSRFCGECKKFVHDLSQMTSDEARALLRAPATEGLCIRYLYDQYGNVVFRPEPAASKLVSAGALNRLKRFAAAATAVAMPLTLTACMGAPPPRYAMGAVVAPPMVTPEPCDVPEEDGGCALPVPEEQAPPVDAIDVITSPAPPSAVIAR